MIVGVDLGTRRAAIACNEMGFIWHANLESIRNRRLFPGEINAGAALGLAARIALTEVGIRAEKLYFERPVVFKNVNTAVGQALSAGAFFSQLPGQSVQIYPSATWKKEVIGSGNASKDDTRAWVEREHQALASACKGVEDCFDAVAICEFGQRMEKLG